MKNEGKGNNVSIMLYKIQNFYGHINYSTIRSFIISPSY